MRRFKAFLAGLPAALALVSGPALGQANDTAARNEMVRIIEMQTMMLSAQTGITEM